MTTLTHQQSPLADVLDWWRWPLTALRTVASHPLRIEDYVSDGHYVLRAEIPDVDPESDIEVTAAGGVVTIKAYRHQGVTPHRHSEFRYGAFTRSIALPPDADQGRIQASYGHGILEISAELKRDPAPQACQHIPVRVNHHIDPA